MRIAIIYWRMIHSVGGIAIHLNRLRDAAIRHGDTCHILVSDSQRRKPRIYPERKWIRGGDTNIWICGEAHHHPWLVKRTIRWLEANYDAVVFGYPCPHRTTYYPSPDFLPIYDVKLPKVAWVMDGYWEMYRHWAKTAISKLDGILCPLATYAQPLRDDGITVPVRISAFPFWPQSGSLPPKSERPLIVWPNQWKDIKGIRPFIEEIPRIHEYCEGITDFELYSCGIRYYQLRSSACWRNAVGRDLFKAHHGRGVATYYGNVDHPTALNAIQRAWFTVNLQGCGTKQAPYKRGSYNNTEVEALYYGACPVLHRSASKTALPDDVYQRVRHAGDLPSVIHDSIHDGFALDPKRRQRARDFVLDVHLASSRYLEMREMLGG
jgi:hypothetical protein